MLPGNLLERELAAEVLKRLKGELGESTAWDWESVSVEAALSLVEILPADEWYLYMKHPVHGFKDRCSRSLKPDVLRFVRERFDQARGEGVDLYLAPLDFSVVFAGNHDGKFFRAK